MKFYKVKIVKWNLDWKSQAYTFGGRWVSEWTEIFIKSFLVILAYQLSHGRSLSDDIVIREFSFSRQPTMEIVIDEIMPSWRRFWIFKKANIGKKINQIELQKSLGLLLLLFKAFRKKNER